MKLTFNALVGASLCIAFFAATSCKKDASEQANNTPVTTEEATTMSQETAEVEGDDGDVTEMGFSAGADLEVITKAAAEPGNANINFGARLDLFADLYFKLAPGAIITVTPNDTTYPKTITVNYGATGLLCRDNKLRRGLVTLTFSAPIRRSGAVLTITVNDFYVNRKHVEGTRIITNLSANGNVKYSVQVKDGKVSWPNGRGFTYASIKTVTQISGSDTRTVRDDAYSIEGSSEIKYANGITVSKSTDSPLIKAVSCDWIVKGVLRVKINNTTLLIDFGNGNCDNKATLTNLKINTTVEIVLP